MNSTIFVAMYHCRQGCDGDDKPEDSVQALPVTANRCFDIGFNGSTRLILGTLDSEISM